MGRESVRRPGGGIERVAYRRTGKEGEGVAVGDVIEMDKEGEVCTVHNCTQSGCDSRPLEVESGGYFCEGRPQ